MKIKNQWIVTGSQGKNSNMLVETECGIFFIGEHTNLYGFHEIDKEEAESLITNKEE